MFDRKIPLIAAVLAAGALFAGSAQASRVHWSVSVNAPAVTTVVSNGRVYYPPVPAPVYYPAAPAPVYYPPAPVYYPPTPVVVYRPGPPAYGVSWDAPYGHRHHHRHGEWRDHHRDEYGDRYHDRGRWDHRR